MSIYRALTAAAAVTIGVSAVIALSFFFPVAASAQTPEANLVNAVAAAMGGKAQVLAVRGQILKGVSHNGDFMNVGSYKELAPIEATEWSRAVDFVHHRVRERAVQVQKSATPIDTTPEDIGVEGEIAYARAEQGRVGGGYGFEQTSRTVVALKTDELAGMFLRDPIGIVQAALAPGTVLSSARSAGAGRMVDILTSQGERATLVVDAKTNLPIAVTMPGFDRWWGDIVNVTEFSNYRDVDGIKVAMRRISKFERFTVADVELTNASLKDFEAASMPPDLPARRPPPPVEVTVLPLGPGLWMLGPTYYCLLVEFSDHTELVEGASATKARAYFETARRLVPNKPVTKVIITHHHLDHAGGLREAVAQGLTIVTYKTNKQYFEEIASRPHTLQPDAQQISPKPVKFELIDEEKTFKDPMRALQLIHMAGNEHSDNLLMVYLPDDKLLINADFWDIRFPRQPFLANMLEIMHKYDVKVDRQVDIHAGLISGALFGRVVAETKGGTVPLASQPLYR